MFIFGFLLMAAEGSGLAALEYVEMDDVIEACNANEDKLAKIKEENDMGWLIVPFTKFARRFDDH